MEGDQGIEDLGFCFYGVKEGASIFQGSLYIVELIM